MRTHTAPYNHRMRTLATSCLLALGCAIALTGPGHAQADFSESDQAVAATKALGAANAIAGVLLAGEEMPPELLAEGGCYVWQQPGAALSITHLWMPAEEAPDLWLTEDRLLNFLQAQAYVTWEEPIRNPSEPLDYETDYFYLPPEVYMMPAEPAQARLRWHMDGYLMWIGFIGGDGYFMPEDSDLLADFAVVFLDRDGPMEFYFTFDDDGKPRLTHLIHYSFFSA